MYITILLFLNSKCSYNINQTFISVKDNLEGASATLHNFESATSET